MKVKVAQSCLNSLRPHGLYSPWNSPGQNTGMGSLSLLQGNLPNPGVEPRSPALQADSLPAEPPEKPCGAHILNHYWVKYMEEIKDSTCRNFEKHWRPIQMT